MKLCIEREGVRILAIAGELEGSALSTRPAPATELAYRGDGEDFRFEAGVAAPALPEGMVAMEYRKDEGIVVYFDAFGNAFPLEGRNRLEALDVVLTPAAVKALQPKQEIRELMLEAQAEEAMREAALSAPMLIIEV
jgi:hypothetical protein